MSESCNILDHLPQAILLEIFCRLPIYDVTRCKVVCRAWLNLLSDPNFTNIYTSNTPFTTLLLEEMMSWSAIGTSSMKLSLLEVSATGEYTRTPLAPIGIPSDHLDYEHTSLVLVGSCNGFLCFSYHKYHSFGTSVVKEGLYINNPITREYIELPQYDEMLNTRDNIVRVKSHHFGFSPSTGEFKVVRIVYSVASIQPLTVDGKPEIRICTVGVDKEWRNLAWNPSNPLIMSNWSNVVTLNGVHHWIVVDKIHTFDIGKEQDGPILHLPVTVVGSSSKSSLSSMELLILNNQLTLVDNYVLSHITIWTMKEYGVVESWAKHVILQDSIPTALCCQKVFPVAVLRNGAMLFLDPCHNGHFILYNPKRKECAYIQIPDIGWMSTAIRFNSYNRSVPIVHSLDELRMGGNMSS